MSERFAVAWGDTDVKKLCHRGQLFFRRSSKVPMKKSFIGIVASVGATIAAKNPGCVISGVEADADEVGLLIEGWVGGERLVDVGKVVAHAGAKICELATSVDERHQNDLAFELVEMNCAVALVQEFEVGDNIAYCGDVVGDGRLVVGACLRYDDDIVETNISISVANLVCKDLRADAIAWVKFADDAGICEFVVHRHCFHEARDIFAIECDVRGICRDDSAANGEGLCCGGSWSGYSRRSVLAASGEKDKESEKK